MNETNHLSLLNALHVLLQYSPAAGSAEGLDDIVECVAGRLGAEVAILPAAGSSADSKSTAEAQLVCVAPACHGCAAGRNFPLSANHAVLCIPAFHESAGVLRVERRNGKPFDAEEMAFLQAVTVLASTRLRRHQLSSELLRSNTLLDGLHDAQTAFITETDPRKVLNSVLDILLSVTGSEYGYIAEVFYDSPTQPWMRTMAMTNIAWNEETRALWAKYNVQGFEFRNLKTLFGASLLEAPQPFIANVPAADPRRGGLPHGHPPLNAFLGIPIMWGKKQIGSIGIANRAGGYDQSVVDLLRPLTATCGAIMRSLRLQRERSADQAQLAENAKLAKLAADVGRVLIEESDLESALHRCGEAVQDALPGAWVWICLLPTPEAVLTQVLPQRSTSETQAPPKDLFRQLAQEVQTTRQGFENMAVQFGPEKAGFISAYPFLVKREPAGVLWVASAEAQSADMTQAVQSIANEIALGVRRIQSEKELRQKGRELQEINAGLRELADLKDRIIAMTSHQFRTPLSVILSSTELLERYGADWPDSKKLHHLARIRRSIDHLQHLLEDVFVLGQMESGQLKLHPESLELGDLVVDLTDSFVENNHRLRIKCDTPSLVCELDPNVFRQIVFNLVSNALKFSPANEPVEIEIVADDVQIRLCVRDYGLGIPPEERTQLGSPFYRGSNVTDVAGTGLGFAIVSRGLALCGGTFSTESELKKGTTIHVSLPQAKQNSIGHQMTGSEDYVSEQPARPN